MYLIAEYQLILYILDFVSLTILFSCYFLNLIALIYIHVPAPNQWVGGPIWSSCGSWASWQLSASSSRPLLRTMFSVFTLLVLTIVPLALPSTPLRGTTVAVIPSQSLSRDFTTLSQKVSVAAVLEPHIIAVNCANKHWNATCVDFYVNGTTLPEVDFDVGESYAGNLPISNNRNESDELFFWFFPTVNEEHQDDKEIVIWLSGGVSSSTSTNFNLFAHSAY